MPNILYPKPTVPNNTVINCDLENKENSSLKKEKNLLMKMVDNYTDEQNLPKNRFSFKKSQNINESLEKSTTPNKILSRQLFKSSEKDSFFASHSIIFR